MQKKQHVESTNSLMRTISIGDIHGRTIWKEIDPTKYDKIIFNGDYVDSYVYSDVEIQSNLLDIIQFKKENIDKVILILGNHDIQYYFLGEGFGCGGYRPSMAENLKMIFIHNKDLFQVAYQYQNYLWTHAGVSNGWLEWNKKEIEDFKERFDVIDYADLFNKMLMTKNNRLLHQVGKGRQGSYLFGGITWADREETSRDYVTGLHQIVGHSPIDQITRFGDEHGSIRYIDVLGQIEFLKEEYAKIEKKWGKNNKYDEKIRELFPDIKRKEDLKLLLPTKFYEQEINERSS